MTTVTVHIRALATGAYAVCWTGTDGVQGDLVLADARASAVWHEVADLTTTCPVLAARMLMSYVETLRVATG